MNPVQDFPFEKLNRKFFHKKKIEMAYKLL